MFANKKAAKLKPAVSAYLKATSAVVTEFSTRDPLGIIAT